MELEEIKTELEKYTHNCVFKQFYIKSLDQLFLCLYGENYGLHFISLFCKEKGLNCVSKIEYSFYATKGYIDYFKVLPEYQGFGLGRFVYNLALAHMDKEFYTQAFGSVAPIGEMKNYEDDSRLVKRQDALVEIYKKLGAKIIKSDEIVFNHFWQGGERYESLQDDQKDFIDEIINIRNAYRDVTFYSD